MSGYDIQAEVRAGLAEAYAETGGAGIKTYLKQKTGNAGNPNSPGTITTVNVELENAIFKSVGYKLLSAGLATASDVAVICGPDVEIKNNDVITQNGQDFIVSNLSVRASAGIVFVYEFTASSQ